jgi:hypothetical protein
MSEPCLQASWAAELSIIRKTGRPHFPTVLQCAAEVAMPYALFLNNDRVSDTFTTKAEAWSHAANRGLVAIFPSRDEDPPRRVLNLSYSIRFYDETNPPLSASQSHNDLSDGVRPERQG